MFDRNVEMEVPCPGCGLKRKFKLKDLEGEVKYVCSGCKKNVVLDANKFARELKDAEKNIKTTFKKASKNMNFKIKM